MIHRDPLSIDAESLERKLVRFIKKETQEKGFRRLVIGLSGGVDSALVCALSARALGPRNVSAFMLPYRSTSLNDIRDAKALIRSLGVKSGYIDITKMVDAYVRAARLHTGDHIGRLRIGNKMARERMSILYDHAKALDALVLGTGNRTELLLGYFTLHGDAACDIRPISGIYKTQVWQLAEAAGIPLGVVQKVPTAGLWPGQTDEGEMGFLYRDVDRLLYYMVDREYSDTQLKKIKFEAGFIKKVRERVARNRYKLVMPSLGPTA